MYPVCATHHGSTEISTGLAGRRSLADFLRKNFWSGTDACLGKSTWISLHLQGMALWGVLQGSPLSSSNTARFKDHLTIFMLKILREFCTHFINIAAGTWKHRNRLRRIKEFCTFFPPYFGWPALVHQIDVLVPPNAEKPQTWKASITRAIYNTWYGFHYINQVI